MPWAVSLCSSSSSEEVFVVSCASKTFIAASSPRGDVLVLEQCQWVVHFKRKIHTNSWTQNFPAEKCSAVW